MEKALQYEAYRNIGFEDGKPKPQRLVISNSLNKGEIGDLVIVIGPNNAGKSNVLDGLVSYGNNRLEKRDITDLFIDDLCRKPALTLSYKTDNGDETYSLRREYGKTSVKVAFPKSEEEKKIFLTYTSKDTLKEDMDYLCNYEKNLGASVFSDIKNNYNLEELSDSEFDSIVLSLFEQFRKLRTRSNLNFSFINSFNTIQHCPIYKDFLENENPNKDLKKILEQEFFEKYGYNFNSNIITYQEKKICNNNLNCDYDKLPSSSFFNELFTAIGVELTTVKNVHDTFLSQNNKGQLVQLQKRLNSLMKKVSDNFNKLYYLETTPYSFNIDLESNGIFFSIFRGDQTLSLDFQSSGFKWFFNLYFGLLNSNELNTGDIIIMDEPATNLHPKGQKELRTFLKEFAIKNDITIVIATHSPFLIDLDYLDELRIITNNNNISSITNSFAAVNPEDPDALLPIKQSLTVDNHVICDPDNDVIFVEGITDYNYLVAFKIILGRENISFLPINGLGKNRETNKKISERLIKIRKKDPKLLVDNDFAGKNMEKTNESASELQVISLGEIDPKFKTIETLFTSEDLAKFGLVDSKGNFIKHASTSSLFKRQVIKNKDSISEETKKNFEKLFDRLCD